MKTKKIKKKIKGIIQLLRCPPCLFSFISCLVAFKISNSINLDSIIFLIGIFLAQNLVGHSINDLVDLKIDNLCFKRKKNKWSGGSKVIQYNLLTKKDLEKIIISLSLLGAAIALYLILKYGIVMLFFVVLGFFLLFFHNYIFQKTFVGEATGTFSYFILPAFISYYILEKDILTDLRIIPMFLFGYFSLTLHHLNDLEEDSLYGKKTICYYLKEKTKPYLLFILFLAYSFIFILGLFYNTKYLFSLITSLILFPLIIELDIRNNESIDNASKKDLYPIFITILLLFFF